MVVLLSSGGCIVPLWPSFFNILKCSGYEIDREDIGPDKGVFFPIVEDLYCAQEKRTRDLQIFINNSAYGHKLRCPREIYYFRTAR